MLTQYIIVAIIILSALTYMVISLRRRSKGEGGGGCCGCGLAENCKSRKKAEKRGKPSDCHTQR